DVCLCASVTLRGLWPMIVARKPYVISHQNVPDSPDDSAAPIKKAITFFSNNISCSRSVQSRILGHSIVIPNTYQSDIFKEFSGITKDLDIVFVGRLVPDKGLEDGIDALSRLRQRGMRPKLSIVGDGPDYSVILQKVRELDLTEQVSFAGV